MECEYICLNPNFLLSQKKKEKKKKVVTKGMIKKGVYCN